jgi:hypothetical protein
MKLARKLTLAILAIMALVLSLNAVERVAHDRRIIRDDIRRDHRSVGHALQLVVRESFRADGEPGALALMKAANQRESAIRIRWLWLDAHALARNFSPAQPRSCARRWYAQRSRPC